MQTNVPIDLETLGAMRTLVRAGVSDEAIGRALRELLLAGKAGAEATPSTLATDSTRAQAEETPRAESLLPGTTRGVVGPAPLPPTPPAPLPAGSVALKVRFPDQKPSNVSIPSHLLQAVAQKLGSEDLARKKVRDLAREVPPVTANKSGWIQAQLTVLVG